MIGEVLSHAQLDEIRKGIKTLRPFPRGALDRRPDKPLLVPVLNLPQGRANNLRNGLTIKRIHNK